MLLLLLLLLLKLLQLKLLQLSNLPLRKEASRLLKSKKGSSDNGWPFLSFDASRPA
jgi:hypothetical protein